MRWYWFGHYARAAPDKGGAYSVLYAISEWVVSAHQACGECTDEHQPAKHLALTDACGLSSGLNLEAAVQNSEGRVTSRMTNRRRSGTGY